MKRILVFVVTVRVLQGALWAAVMAWRLGGIGGPGEASQIARSRGSSG